VGALAGAMIQWGKTSVFLISVTEQNKCAAGRQYKSTASIPAPWRWRDSATGHDAIRRLAEFAKLPGKNKTLAACYVQAANKILPHFHFMNGSGF
jgi:hypothetical protein